MLVLGLARKFRESSNSRLLLPNGVVGLHTAIYLLSTYSEQWEKNVFSSTIVLPVTDFISPEVGHLTHARKWKGVVGVEHSTMLTSISVGIPGLSQQWKSRGLTMGGSSTLGRCITAPVRTSGRPNRDEWCNVGKSLRTQSCRCSSSVVQASSEVEHSEKNVVPKVLKTTIYDRLETERITAELFPELDFPLEGNFYPKLVKLVARKINVFLEEVGGEGRVPALLKHLGMKLNPHIVAEVMALQENAIKFNHFFDWAASQPDFEHNSHTYNRKFWNLICKKGAGPGDNNLVLPLILLDEMIAKGLNPGNLECNVLIDRLCKAKKVGAALKLTRLLEREGFPDIYTYNSLINGFGKAGLLEDIREVLNEMRQKGCNPDRITYNSVINGLCKAGLFQEVYELVDEMTEKRCGPDTVTYNSIIHGLCNASRWQEALKIFDELECKEIIPDVVTYNSLMVGLFKCGQPNEARKVYDLMGLKGCPPDRITYNIFINGYLNYNQVDEAWKIFRFMEEEGFTPDEVTYNTLIGGLVENYRMKDALKVFAEMKEKGCKPDVVTFKLVGLSQDVEQHGVGEENSSHRSGRNTVTNEFGSPTIVEDERQVLHN